MGFEDAEELRPNAWGNDLYPFVLPLEKDAHIFEIVMPQSLASRLEACILSVCIFCLSRKGQHHFSTLCKV